MLSKLAKQILNKLGDFVEKTRYFDEAGNDHYIFDYNSLKDIVGELGESVYLPAIQELEGQGFVRRDGQIIKLTFRGFDNYRDCKKPPMGLIPPE